jgi:hypothetical protein
MAKLRTATGPKYLAGIALYLGQRSYTYDARARRLGCATT